jgi:hypothetical protein
MLGALSEDFRTFMRLIGRQQCEGNALLLFRGNSDHVMRTLPVLLYRVVQI